MWTDNCSWMDVDRLVGGRTLIFQYGVDGYGQSNIRTDSLFSMT